MQLNKPIPDDLIPILAKDKNKQRAIKDKSIDDAASAKAKMTRAATPVTAQKKVAIEQGSEPKAKGKVDNFASGSESRISASGTEANRKQKSGAPALRPGTASSTEVQFGEFVSVLVKVGVSLGCITCNTKI